MDNLLDHLWPYSALRHRHGTPQRKVRVSVSKGERLMDKYEECWLCGAPLGEEVQYCASCEIARLKEILTHKGEAV